jgi:hypothetical protein
MARRSRPQQGPIQPATAEPHAPTLPFPVEVFPTPLRRFIREVAEALPCLPDFVGVPLLAVLGTAIGTSRVLEVKPGWLEGPRRHAQRVYARLRSTRGDQRAETALRWLQAHGRACTVRDLQRHRVAGLTRASQEEKPLRDLVDLGQGELRERQLPSGRTQRVFVLHTHAES